MKRILLLVRAAAALPGALPSVALLARLKTSAAALSPGSVRLEWPG